MKKIFLFILFTIMLLPLGVFAEEKVNVYVFRGEGCPHCEELLTYLKTNDKINIIDYEVWGNEKNDELMKIIIYLREEDNGAEGVPYFIIGNKSWFGYSSDMNSEIEEQINKVYLQDVDQRFDIMKKYDRVKDSVSIDDYNDYYSDDSDDYDDEYYDDGDYELYCEDYGYVEEDTMIGAALIAFVAGVFTAGVPLIIIIVILSIVLIKNKRNG